jgi:hypothetical protein
MSTDRQTYSASFAATTILGGGNGSFQSTLMHLDTHVYCSQASTAPGSAVQVDVSWTDDGVPMVENIIIGLDALTSKDVRTIDIWADWNTDIQLTATLIGDGQFGIDWEDHTGIE